MKIIAVLGDHYCTTKADVSPGIVSLYACRKLLSGAFVLISREIPPPMTVFTIKKYNFVYNMNKKQPLNRHG